MVQESRLSRLESSSAAITSGSPRSSAATGRKGPIQIDEGHGCETVTQRALARPRHSRKPRRRGPSRERAYCTDVQPAAVCERLASPQDRRLDRHRQVAVLRGCCSGASRGHVGAGSSSAPKSSGDQLKFICATLERVGYCVGDAECSLTTRAGSTAVRRGGPSSVTGVAAPVGSRRIPRESDGTNPFTSHLDLPQGQERELAVDRERVYNCPVVRAAPWRQSGLSESST